MRFAIRVLLTALLLSPAWAQQQDIEVRVRGAADIEVLVRNEASSVWRSAGKAGQVIRLQEGEFEPNNISGRTHVDVILRGPGYLPIFQKLGGPSSSVVVLEGRVVPQEVRVTLHTVPPDCTLHGPNQKLWGRGILEITPSEYLPLAKALQWSLPAYELNEIEATLSASGYREREITLGPDFWTSSSYPPEPLVLEPEKGPQAFFQRNPQAIPALSTLSLLTVLGILFGVHRVKARLRKGDKLEKLRADDHDPLSGAVLGSYRLGHLLGEGAMGAVYLAVPEEGLERERAVAVKVIHRRLAGDPEFLSRFYREVRVAGELIHPNIVECLDWGSQDGLLYLVMELLEGESICKRVRPNAPIEEVAGYLVQIGRALQYAHSLGVVHRDIKPENVMLLTRTQRIKVMDFGLAKKHDASTLTATGAIFGTPAYLPPEQARSEPVDAAADQYSFGVMAFELLVGERPYQADEPVQMMLKHVSEPIPSILDRRPDLPSELAAMVARLMAKKPAERYPSMEDVVAILEAYL